FTEGILRHCADHQRANCSDDAFCSSWPETSRCSSCAYCAGSSNCSDRSNALKFLLARQAAVLAAVALLPAAGEATYFRNKISWRSAIASSEMLPVDEGRAWCDT